MLSHALALSANGVDVGEVDEVVEDEGGREWRERKKTRAWEKERKRKRGQGRARRPTRRETKRKSGGRRAGEETGDKERRVDDEGRRR